MMMAGALTANAQSGTNSPYTRYGLGDLAGRGFAGHAAMGGVGYGVRNSNQVNLINPAAISSVDSLSFMFDVGMSLRSSNYKENGIKNNAKNSSFDYIAMQFRLHKRLGIALSFTPYSTTGYNFNSTTPISYKDGTSAGSTTNTFYGDGGLQQFSVGLGFKVLKNLSVGVNAGYMYGSIDYQAATSPSSSSDQTINYRNLSVNSYNANFGIQYTQQLNKNDNLTVGLVYGLGHKLNSTYTTGTQVTDNSSFVQTNENKEEDGFGIPHTFGVGLAYNKKKNLTVGLDYTIEKWSKVKYNGLDNQYNDMSKVSAGIEYTPNTLGRNYLKRISYRVGVYYNNSYLKLPTCDGPKELGVSAGFGLPLHLFQRNTMLNITGQYVHLKPSVSNMLSENRFVIKLGLTFNEHWFMKWKVN